MTVIARFKISNFCDPSDLEGRTLKEMLEWMLEDDYLCAMADDTPSEILAVEEAPTEVDL